MSSSSESSCAPVFLLTGFPGLEGSHGWISIPICSMYLTAVAGNCTILFLIRTDRTLHEPMYYFLSMLAFADLGLSATTLPTMLCVLWFNHRAIDFSACLVQMYFIHTLSIAESGILLSMAFDRLVAIRNPLRYTSTLTNATIVKIGTGVAVWAALLVFPASFLLKRQQYGRENEQHLVAVVSSMLVLSYILILRTVLSIASKEECLRALNTCISHICAVLTFYIPTIGLSIIRRYGKNAPPAVHILMANGYLLVPPLMNPVGSRRGRSQLEPARTSILQTRILPLY
ncbi:hypothetical protein lerEdw1_012722 [Lerista edwardsae]|nr:hypothetical protein lerEdw1_012722 [Lerista edwardsae]